MKVLMVSKACVVGTYQRKLEELARQPDMELTAVVPPFWRDAGRVQRLERKHTCGYTLCIEPMVFNGNYHLHFYPWLGRQIRRLQPELVHIDEEPYNVATAHTLNLARRADARTVFFSWQNIQQRYPLPFRLIENYVLRYADQGIVGNQESAEVWRAKGYRGPIAVIPQFGVDPEIFFPTRTRCSSPFTIGYVGRLVEEKGIDLLLEALAGIEGAWQAIIVGSGPARNGLEAQAHELDLQDQVSFVPHVPSSEMPALYHRLDALTLPSRTRPNWKEQFGRVLVEAMASGVPVVGSDSGEIPHVIGQAGLLFSEGDPEALRSCIQQLAADPNLREELAKRGRQRVQAHYTQAEIAARTFQVYQSILGA